MRKPKTILAALVIAVVAAAAAHADKATPSKVSIRLSDDGTAIEGTVKSDSPRCEKNRKVKVKAKERGFFSAIDRTDESGRYRVEGPGGPMPPERYSAQALNKQGDPDCPAAKSKVIKVE